MKIWIGYDPIDALAYEKCVKSIKEHASVPVYINPLRDWELRKKGIYWRPYFVDKNGQKWDDRDGKPFSTDFSFTRFCVPALENYDEDWVLFCDPDMLFRADVKELLDLVDDSKSLMCVKHEHHPPEGEKMGGLIQTQYRRKNWSSLMLFNVHKCHSLTKFVVNNETGAFLHGMCWLPDDQIGSLPEEWNWLDGWSDPKLEPKVIHYTRGTPDMGVDTAYSKEWWAA